MRISVQHIRPEDLMDNDVFVFGSNESGIHGAGAAKDARVFFGATMHQGFGPSGRSFAIPTKDWLLVTLELKAIGAYIKRFIEYAKIHKKVNFHVTEIGCGLAGYRPSDIAPYFIEAKALNNVLLPKSFVDELENPK